MCLSHIHFLVTVLITWSVIICVYPTSRDVSIPPLYPFHLLKSTWSVIKNVYPTSLLLSPPYQLDLPSFVFIPPLYPCHLLINLISHQLCLPYLYPCHLLINLICHHLCLPPPHFCISLLTRYAIICVYPTSVPVTFLSTWSVIILCVYPTSLPLSHPHERDLSSFICVYPTYLSLSPSCQLDVSFYVFISHIYSCNLLINLMCHPAYIPSLYPCTLLINLICHHMCLPHLSILVTSFSTWSVIICVYFTSISTLGLVTFLSTWSVIMCLSHLSTLVTPYQLDLSSYMCLSHLSSLVTSYKATYQLDLSSNPRQQRSLMLGHRWPTTECYRLPPHWCPADHADRGWTTKHWLPEVDHRWSISSNQW